MAVDLPALKKVKNTVIGNPSAKLSLAQDQAFIRTLVNYLNPPRPSSNPTPEQYQALDAIRTEAAHIIASVSYGSQTALHSLLQAGAPHTLIRAISFFPAAPMSPPASLKTAFARALRALVTGMADVVGPSQWGLRIEKDSLETRTEARAVLDQFFQVTFLDIYLPLLADPSPQTCTSIAQLIGAAVRTTQHRAAVAEWLPPADRSKEVKGKRGWEKPDMKNANAPSRMGGWVARTLSGLIRSRDAKSQEAALMALATVAKDNPYVAVMLGRAPSDRDPPSPLMSALALTKSRSVDVQLAACLCATHIIRASASNHPLLADSSSALTVLHVVNRMISSPMESDYIRTKACFVLYYLISDDNELCQTAVERGSLSKLAALLKSLAPPTPSPDEDMDEPHARSALREAALTALAGLALFDNDIRRAVTDQLGLVPILSTALTHSHVGVRCAACQCVRALSRAVAVVRTSILDSGLGTGVFEIFKREGEDRRVTHASLAAVCNIVNEFSPLRPVFLEDGVVPRLVQVSHSGDPDLRLNAFWAIKNLLRKTTVETKRRVMGEFGWGELAAALKDADLATQEQAWNIVRNLAEHEPGIETVFSELGQQQLLDSLTDALDSRNEDVVLQAAYTLANLTNGTTSNQVAMLAHAPLLRALHDILSDANVELRRPAVCAVLQLARTGASGSRAGVGEVRAALGAAGIIKTLRYVCEWNGAGVSMSPGAAIAPEDDREVREQARHALDWLEHTGGVEEEF